MQSQTAYFYTKTSLLALAGVDFLVFVWQKTEVRTRSHSVAVREFLLPAGPSSLLRTVSVTALWKLVSYGLRPQYYVFLSSNTLFASVKAGGVRKRVLCSGEQRKRSLAALMDYINNSLCNTFHLSRRRVKTLQTNIQFVF